MTDDERPGREATEQPSASVLDVLFAVDLKRLVRASQDNDNETVSELRERYVSERIIQNPCLPEVRWSASTLDSVRDLDVM